MLDLRADDSPSLPLALTLVPEPSSASEGKYSSLEPCGGAVVLGDTSESERWIGGINEAVAISVSVELITRKQELRPPGVGYCLLVLLANIDV